MKEIDIPKLLREIADPPKKLYLRGELPDPEEYLYIAFVGSRKFSSYGRDACEEIIAGLAGQKVVIVSGLAIGMDSIAHRAAMKAGLATVAVPGSGLDRSVIYPAVNRPLAEEILKKGGALLSEFEPKARAALWTFPQRNRIMAGLCHGSVIIEATEKSGTLITARLALEYNRDVFAVPGSIFALGSVGPNELLRVGATPLTKASDILDTYNLTPGTNQKLPLDLSQFTALEAAVLESLIESKTRDTLIDELGLPVNEANTLLISMEMKGLIKESLGEIHRTG